MPCIPRSSHPPRRTPPARMRDRRLRMARPDTSRFDEVFVRLRVECAQTDMMKRACSHGLLIGVTNRLVMQEPDDCPIEANSPGSALSAPYKLHSQSDLHFHLSPN